MSSWSVSLSRLRSADRFDAEFFLPEHDRLEKKILATGEAVRLEELAAVVRRGKQPRYVEDGPVAVINSQHVGAYFVEVDRAESTDTEFWEENPNARAQRFDVLLNSTGIGTVGRAGVVLHDEKTVVDNHVTIIRLNDQSVDPTYLGVFLNSRLGRSQTDRWVSGSSGQVELYPSDIRQFWVIVPSEDIQEECAKTMTAACSMRSSAIEKAVAAMSSVENLI